MITLAILAYIIASLFIARHKYWDMDVHPSAGNVNPCYMNGKKALIAGFMTIPFWIVIIGAAVTLVYLFFKCLEWIIINMP